MVNIVDYSKCLDVLINYGYSEESIIEVLNKLFEINGISEFTNYRLDNKLISTAQFVPRYNKIFINPSRIPIWLKNNIDDDNILPNIEDRNKLKDYYVLNILVHEVEHAKQY